MATNVTEAGNDVPEATTGVTSSDAVTDATDLIQDGAIVPKTIEIYKHGDLYLIVRGKVKLRVSSQVLCVASDAFAAMLGPDSVFLEGQQNLSSIHPGEVKLPDDDPEGMTALCRVLHHDQKFIHEKRVATFVIAVCSLSQKYFMVQSIYHWLSSVLTIGFAGLEAEHEKTKDETYARVCIAKVLGDGPAFTYWTGRMILMDKGEILRLCICSGSELLPKSLFVLLAERRNRLRLRFLEQIYDLRVEQRIPEALEEFYEEALINLRTGLYSLSNIVDEVRSIAIEEQEESGATLDSAEKEASTPTWPVILCMFLTEVMGADRCGLCLDCAQTNSIDALNCEGLGCSMAEKRMNKKRKAREP